MPYIASIIVSLLVSPETLLRTIGALLAVPAPWSAFDVLPFSRCEGLYKQHNRGRSELPVLVPPCCAEIEASRSKASRLRELLWPWLRVAI